MENPGRFKSALIVSMTVPSIIYIVFAFTGVIFYNQKGIHDIIIRSLPLVSH